MTATKVIDLKSGRDATASKSWGAKAGNSRSVHDTPAINSPHPVRRTKKVILILSIAIIKSSGDEGRIAVQLIRLLRKGTCVGHTNGQR